MTEAQDGAELLRTVVFSLDEEIKHLRLQLQVCFINPPSFCVYFSAQNQTHFSRQIRSALMTRTLIGLQEARGTIDVLTMRDDSEEVSELRQKLSRLQVCFLNMR